MIRTGVTRALMAVAASAALLACGPGPVPNDVASGVGFGDYQDYQLRQQALRNGQPQTVLPPGDGAPGTFATASSAQQSVTPADPRQPQGRDIASIASAALDEVEGTRAITGSGEDFVAPPLPSNVAVLGANVVAFALTTTHPVGERVWQRFPLRLGRPEVRCSDFRTTDLAQDWFLTNGGPERDRANLDRDGDGYACNWDPERYRAEARAARAPQAGIGLTAPPPAGFSTNVAATDG